MTERRPTDPRRSGDDLVSAVLDGEATAAERERVEADPLLAARLDEFDRVARAVAQPVDAVDATTRDHAIAAALDRGVDTAAPDEAPVVPLRPADDARRRDRGRRVMLVAAVVLGGIVLAAGLLGGFGDDGGEDQAAVTAGEAEDAGADAVVVPDVQLGSVKDTATLRRRIIATTGLIGTTGSTPEADSSADTATEAEQGGEDPTAPLADDRRETGRTAEDCAIELVEARAELIGQLAQGTVTYQGAEGYVLVYNDSARGGAVGIVVAADDCAVLTEVDL